MGEILFPSVRWAQDERNVYLKVELRNVSEPELTINRSKVEFQAVGEGAKGRNQYNFNLDLFGTLNEKDCLYKVSDRNVNIVLRKDTDESKECWWPQLTSKICKFPWLKIDFDRWKEQNESESDKENGDRGDLLRNFDMQAYEEQQAQEMVDKIMKEGGYDATKRPSLTKTYLLTYNSALFFGFLFIVVELVRGFVLEGPDYFPKVWSNISQKMICCLMAQIFEIFHSVLGYVKSDWTAVAMQVAGRSFVLFALLLSEPRMQDKPFVFYLFLVWSLVELVRYPYYALAVMKKEFGIVTWLRYTIWIVLYPLGFLVEGVIILRAMPFFEETRRFSYPLPNVYNVSIDFPSVLKLYLFFCLIPGIVFLMSHMRSQRLKKLSVKKKKTK